MAKDALKLLRQQVIAHFNRQTSGKQNAMKNLTNEYQEVNTKIERLEERYIEEEIGKDLYRKYRGKYDEEKLEIERNLMKLSKQVSNLEKVTDVALKFCI